MWIKDFSVSAWLVLFICLSGVSSSGWKPIAPPADYYTTKPTVCTFDCDPKQKFPFSEVTDGEAAGSQLRSTLINQPTAFNQDKEHRQSNQKLDLDIFKPTEVSFFPQERGTTFKTLIPTYQEVLRKSPSAFISFKTFGSTNKPTKTIYYGDLELAKPKFTNDIKYYKPYKQNDVTIFNPSTYVDNEVGVAYRHGNNPFDEHCSLYKVSFRQDLYYQYVQYKVHMPELKEFTLCLWTRFHNHSHDHSLFSYSVKRHHKAIYIWVSNLNEPGFFSMKLMGQTIFRLNYPVKLYKWYHTCQSWNGNTGEWQVWVNSHRIARGFHNLLVGKSIPGGGTAISGQEQRHFGKGFQEIPHHLKGSGGLEGELTMLQMYKIALSAGKAYNDHSHHHSHYASTTPEPPELPSEEPSTTTDHPFLENGQLKTHINVLELAEALKAKEHLDNHDHKHHHSYDHESLNEYSPEFFNKHLPHPYVAHVSPLAVQGNTINFVGLPQHAIFKRNDETEAKEMEIEAEQVVKEKKIDPEKIKFLNISDQVHVQKIKYSTKLNPTDDVSVEKNSGVLPQTEKSTVTQAGNTTVVELSEDLMGGYSDEELSEENTSGSGFRVGRKRQRRHNPRSGIRKIANHPMRKNLGIVKQKRFPTYRVVKRGDSRKIILSKEFPNNEKEASKRHILFEEPYLNFGSLGLMNHGLYTPYSAVQSTGFGYDNFPHIGQSYGGIENDDDDGTDENPEPERGNKEERELAEGEVRRIISLCSGCHLDPFRKVAVISWRSTPKKIYSGALFLKAKSECDNF